MKTRSLFDNLTRTFAADVLQLALRLSGGDLPRAARALGVSLDRLLALLEEYGVRPSARRRRARR